MILDREPGPLLPFSSDAFHEAYGWLLEEAEVLDQRRHRDWLELLAKDITYRVPVRITTGQDLDNSLLADMAHFDEDLYSLTKRVDRFDTEYAWTEDPPSRTRRFVTNVRVFAGAADDELVARSYLLLFRSRGDVRDADLLSGARRDVLRRTDQGLRLVERVVALDESVLPTQNLAVFL
jgi:3-phenylpropionate/cinnamic acid dioxygenase small subunit